MSNTMGMLHVLFLPILEYTYRILKANINVHPDSKQGTSASKPLEYGLGVGTLHGMPGARSLDEQR